MLFKKFTRQNTKIPAYVWKQQWRRLHRARGYLPPRLQMAGHGGGALWVANKKLTKLWWPSRKGSPKRLYVIVEPEKWRGTTKFFPVFVNRTCASPTYKFVPAPLANSTTAWRSGFMRCAALNIKKTQHQVRLRACGWKAVIEISGFWFHCNISISRSWHIAGCIAQEDYTLL